MIDSYVSRQFPIFRIKNRRTFALFTTSVKTGCFVGNPTMYHFLIELAATQTRDHHSDRVW